MIDRLELRPRTSLGVSDLTHKIMTLTGAVECEIIQGVISGISYQVAYIVTHNTFEDLGKTSLDGIVVDGIIKINHMPTLENGERDIEALKTLTPPISLFQRVIDDHVAKNPVIDQGITLKVPTNKNPERLHLRPLLESSTFQQDTVSSATETLKPAPKTNQTDTVSTHKDALVTGVALDSTGHSKTLVESLVNAAKNFQGKIEYLDGSESESQSLENLLTQARNIRNSLINTGVNPGDYALIHAEHPQEILPAFWACILGGVIPTITPIPPNYHSDAAELGKLSGVWQLLDQPKIITTERTLGKLKQSGIFDNDISDQQLLTLESLDNHNSEAQVDHIADENDIAFICLSSGSTGTPKCIQMTHKNVLVRSRGTNHICQNTSEDIILNWLPFDHIGSISDWHIRCIEIGCQMVYCNKEAILADPLEWMDIINHYRVSHTWAPNFAYSAVNVALKQLNEARQWDLSCVKIFLTAAETVSAETIHEFTSRLSQYNLVKNTIRPAFGMAEMGSGVTYIPPKEDTNIVTVSRESIGKNLQQVPVGTPDSLSFTCLGNIIPSMTMRIVTEKGELLKEGVIGRLHMKGDCITPGYYKNAEANRVFLNDGWMDTGDEGFILDQKLYLSGRTKDTIIIGGANYLPIEIEKTIEAINGVAVSYVAATAVKPIGDKTESLGVFFSLNEDDADLETIVKQIKESVPQKMGVSPNYIVCLPKHGIPKTAIGKIQRSQLKKQFEQGEFNSIVEKIDLLIENNRTIPNWFSEKQWIQYQRPNEVTPTIESLILLTYGKLSAQIADQLKIIAKNNAIECHIVPLDPLGFKPESNDFTEHETNSELLNIVNTQNKAQANIVNLLFLEDFNDATNNHLLLALQNIKKLAKSIKEQQTGHAISLVSSHSTSQEHMSDDVIFYQSLPSLFRSMLSDDSLSKTCIDINTNNLFIKNLFQELICPQDDQEILLDKDYRYCHRISAYQNLTTENTSTSIKPQGLYVITGGLGGIGQEISSWLLTTFNAKLIIIGRSSLKTIEASFQKKQALDSLKSLGDVTYLSSDLKDAGGLNLSIEKIEASTQQEVAGFFHLAGIVSEIPFIDDNLASMNTVLEAKAYSALTIHPLILKRPHAISVYFSSTLSTITSAVAPIYALANRMLDNLAEQERKSGIKSYSIAWSSWKNTGMSANSNADAFLAAQGLYSLNPEQALHCLALTLSRDPANVIIGVNQYAKALEKLSYNPVQTQQTLHLAYSSTKPVNAIDELSAHSLTASIGSSIVNEFVIREDGSIDTDKMTSIISGEKKFLEASNDVEIALTKIWCETLKMDRISVDDNFFALGGHSLLAAELVSKINKTLQASLAIGSVFEASSIKEQALLLDNATETDHTQIIPLQKKGHQRPLFCLCGIDIYQSLANKLAPNIPVYGIFLPIEGKLFDAENKEHIDVETMAKEYVAAILKVQDKGPYRLTGISFGSILAYETAKQLQALGHDIELLSMIDFILPNQPLRNIFRTKKLTLNSPIELVDSLLYNTKALIRKVLSIFKKEKPPTDSRKRVQQEYKLAWNQYRKNMTGWGDSAAVVIFRSQDEAQQQGYSKTLSCGWEQVMNNVPEAHLIPGDHLGVLKEPNVDNIASVLNARLLK